MPQTYKTFFIIAFLFLATAVYSQNVLQLVPTDGTSATELINQIIADTTANNGIPADRVYELVGGQVYLAQQTFYIAQEHKLRIRSSSDEKAIVYLYPSGTGSNPQNPPGYLFRARGGDLELTGLAVSGIFEPVDSNFFNMQGGMFRSDEEGSSFRFNNCIFSNISGQILRTNASTVTVEAKNCIFTNLGNLATSNLGAGKGIDLRDVSCDSLILVNNTFTNYQDRVVRHYNFGNPLEGTGDIGYGLIDHNTFYNGMGFHGTLSLGNIGDEMHITNNLFVDAFSAGEDSTDETRAAEWANNGEFYPNGLNRMTWIFSAPNDTSMWNVAYNYYAISAEGQAFFDANSEDPILEGEPLSWHINSRIADSTTAFTKIDDPQFTEVEDLMLGIMEYYVDPTLANKTKDTPNSVWDRAIHDMDRKPLDYWINTFDVAYSTSSTAYAGADGGFPAGNLNAFPSKKTEWEAWVVGVEEVSSEIPANFKLSQNYPNPFNPTTVIRFSLPEASNVSLKVYDVLGSEVANLVSNIEKPAGEYEVEFDASQISSGIYFYTLNTGNFVQTKKMMLIK